MYVLYATTTTTRPHLSPPEWLYLYILLDCLPEKMEKEMEFYGHTRT